MTKESVSPLRQRMIEDMRIRGMGDKEQKSHIRAIKDLAAFLGRVLQRRLAVGDEDVPLIIRLVLVEPDDEHIRARSADR